MAGYSRTNPSDIIANAVIKAGPLSAELNAIRDAFLLVGGHRHDGVNSDEGAYVPLIADTDGLNKVVVDTANNRISFYSEVGGAAVEQVRVQDGAIVPVTDNDIDLGTASQKFKNLYIEGIGNIGSVVILGGTIDGTVIGSTTPAAGRFTSVVTPTADIDGGTIDNTVIGATTPVAGTFTSLTAADLTTTGSSILPTVVIGQSAGSSGTLDGVVIGSTNPQPITGTSVTSTTGFLGDITGDLTGNVTAISGTSSFNNINASGTITGNVTGDLTGNVTAATGTTTLNDLVVNGTVDFTSTALLNVSDPTAPQQAATKNYVDTKDALKLNLSGGSMTGNIVMGGYSVTGLPTPTLTSDAATKGYVDSEVAALVDAAPGTLDTLNELAAALGDDPNFSTTITTSIAGKLPLSGGTMAGDINMGGSAQLTNLPNPTLGGQAANKTYVDDQDNLKLNLTGGTMSGSIEMSTSKITGLGNPTSSQDAATKAYVDSVDVTKLSLSGGVMSGDIGMGTNKVTNLGTPTLSTDAATKGYTDSILGSATAASASAAAAATSASQASSSATSANSSAIVASNFATSASNAASFANSLYDQFDDRYLGSKSSAPSTDNDGNALLTGALYWDTTGEQLYLWDGSAWTQAAFTASGFMSGANNLSDVTDVAQSRANLNVDEAGTALALAIALG